MGKKGYEKAEWGVLGAFWLLGLIGVLVGGNSLIHGVQSRGWPHVAGQVIRVQVVSVASTLGGHAGSGTPNYRPDVVYEYTVSSRTYTQSRLFFGSPNRYDERHAQKLCASYSPGQTVNVYYNPAHPQESVLRPGLIWEGAAFTLSIALGGAALVLVSSVGLLRGLWVFLRNRSDQKV